MKIIVQNKNRFDVVTYDKEGNEICCADMCQYVYVKSIERNLSTGECFATLIMQEANGLDVEIEAPFDALTDTTLKLLKSRGLTVPSDKKVASLVCDWLVNDAKTKQSDYCHSHLGFKPINGKMHYLVDCALPNSITTHYNGVLTCERSCDADVWREGITPFVRRSPQLQLALTLGSTACVNYYLSEVLKIPDISSDTPMYSFVGKTSSGKTTALMLAASMWGSMDMIAGGSDTNNSYTARLSDSIGYPLFIDELTGAVAAKRDMTNILYQISSGRGKGRSNSGGTLQARQKWQSAICFTSELSVIDACTNHSEGLYVRLLEFEFDAWTDSAKQSEDIKAFVQRNYGSGWELLVQFLLYTDSDVLKAAYQQVTARVDKVFSVCSDGRISRLSSICKGVMFTAYALSQALDIEFKFRAILEYLIQACNRLSNPELSDVDICYKMIRDFAISRGVHPKAFGDACPVAFDRNGFVKKQFNTVVSTYAPPIYQDNSFDYGDPGGYIFPATIMSRYPLDEYAFISFTALEEMLKKDGRFEFKKVKRQLYERGYLQKIEADRYVSGIRIDNDYRQVVCFKIIADEESQTLLRYIEDEYLQITFDDIQHIIEQDQAEAEQPKEQVQQAEQPKEQVQQAEQPKEHPALPVKTKEVLMLPKPQNEVLALPAPKETDSAQKSDKKSRKKGSERNK